SADDRHRGLPYRLSLRLARTPGLIGIASLVLGVASGAAVADEQEALAQTANALPESVRFRAGFGLNRGLPPEGHGSLQATTMHLDVPIALDDRWRLISQTDLSYLNTDNGEDRGKAHGLGESFETVLLSPQRAVRAGFGWGAGVVARFDTANTGLPVAGQ